MDMSRRRAERVVKALFGRGGRCRRRIVTVGVGKDTERCIVGFDPGHYDHPHARDRFIAMGSGDTWEAAIAEASAPLIAAALAARAARTVVMP